jgi:ATP-dependent protease ClpP protease subunit
MEDAVVTGMEQKRKELGQTVNEFYAIPRDPPSDSKLPIFDEAHVRNAMARLSQVKDATAQEKATAKRKIITAAKKYGIDTTNFEKVAMGNTENAVLKIYGDIGESDGNPDNISAADVAQFLEQNKTASNITIKINSRGGDVQEGWAIYDLLTSSGKNITTIGEGKIYSIATIIFLAGTDREIMKNADGLIHNPFIPPYTLADQYESTDLLKIAEALQQEEAKILDFYVEKTGSPKDKLAEYMKEDTRLSAEDMLTLGFATKIIESVKAYAYYKPKNSFIMNENDVKTFGQKIDAIMDKIKNLTRLPANDLVLTDKDGKKLTLTKPSGAPVVGDEASPDGTYAMTNGDIITVLNGKVTDVKATMAAKTELELANEKIVDLQKQLDAEKAKIADAEKVKPDLIAQEVQLKAKVTEAQGLVAELSAIKNSWHPESRTKFSSSDKVGEIDLKLLRELMKNDKKE